MYKLEQTTLNETPRGEKGPDWTIYQPVDRAGKRWIGGKINSLVGCGFQGDHTVAGKRTVNR